MSLRILIFSVVTLVGCKPETPDIKNYLDGWEHTTTFRVLPGRTITVHEKESKITLGDNDVIVVELESKPIFKPGQEVTDLHSFKSLLIELDSTDSLVRPNKLGSSKIFRRVVAFSPEHGTNILRTDEQIEIIQLRAKRWAIKSGLPDFQFSGEFSFMDSSVTRSVHRELYN